MSILQIRNHDRPNKAVRVYTSIEHALRVANTQRVWAKQSSQKNGDSDWYGATYEEALQMSQRGWQDGAKLVRKAFASLPAPTLSAGNAWRNDYFGEQIDMARFSSGEDACFRTRNGNNRGRMKLVRIIVPMGFPCSTSSSAVVNRGSAIISIVDALEMTRRTVEVVASFSSTSHGSRSAEQGFHMNHCVVVKQAGQPFDIPRMAFFIAHRASLRRIGFALMETVKQAEKSHEGNYGYGCDIHPDEQSPTSIALPELHSGDWSSPEKSRNTLAEIVRASGHQLTFRN